MIRWGARMASSVTEGRGYVDQGSSAGLSQWLAGVLREAPRNGAVSKLFRSLAGPVLDVDLRAPAHEELHDREQFGLVKGPDLLGTTLESEVGPCGDRREEGAAPVWRSVIGVGAGLEEGSAGGLVR